jgi:hypothetical protein
MRADSDQKTKLAEINISSLYEKFITTQNADRGHKRMLIEPFAKQLSPHTHCGPN